MKNYYELLEVSEKASPEVIKKAYITLVKKYHPDLQPNSEKKSAEEKIKEINEAYEILSDKNKRENYDKKLQIQRVKEEQSKYANINKNQQNNTNNYRQNEAYSPQTSQTYNSSNKPPKKVIRKPSVKTEYSEYDVFNDFQKDYNNIMNEVYHNAYNEAYNNAYNQAYINNLKNMGYEIQYERPFKEKIRIIFSTFCGILLFLFICFILWHIPFIKNYFIDLYNNNSIFKLIVDLVSTIVNSFLALFK